jgi:hypothetical protein
LIKNIPQDGAYMKLLDLPTTSGFEATQSLRKPLCAIFASTLGLTATLLILPVCAGTAAQTSAGKEQYVRLSTPKRLAFNELVQLEKTDEPSAQLAARLDQLLHTSFISNEA